MTAQQNDKSFEENYLQNTLAIADKQLEEAQAAMAEKRSDLAKEKRESWETVAYLPSGLTDANNFEALIQFNQNMNYLTEISLNCDELAKKIRRLENFIRSPYFARIDFLFDGDDIPEKIYIGRTPLTGDEATLYVYDWRSPIASLFYRFVNGPAYYDAPGGRISGQLEKKRQYEIKNRHLLYFFDTDLSINDEILRNILSQNASPQMKAIVETIQREQDDAIRNVDSDLLLIQGVAGSGKTSVALHRAAYLMYQGLRSKLSASNILILSPNLAFEAYISNVLPELGEENVVSQVFDDILRSVLKEREFQTKNEFLELALKDGKSGALAKKSMTLKTSKAFQKVLDAFIASLPDRIPFEDLYLGDICVAKAETLRETLVHWGEVPLAIRLEHLASRVKEDAFQGKKHLDKLQKNRLEERLQAVTHLELYALYQEFWENAKELSSTFGEDFEEIRQYTLENLCTDCLYFDDATVLLYLHLCIYGTSEYRGIRQVIIDEAQDYYPLQYEIFSLLFPNARFTVLGDINQDMVKGDDLSLYQGIEKALHKKKVSYLTLNKSFRCTNEILQFSLQFISGDPHIKSFNRPGDGVTSAFFSDHAAYLAHIASKVQLYKEKGCETIALICKTEQKCKLLLEELRSLFPLQSLKNNQENSLRGTWILPAYQAKGLEFDAVILCDADAESYWNETDRRILYVSCTRALHHLCLLGEGEKSPLLKENN